MKTASSMMISFLMATALIKMPALAQDTSPTEKHIRIEKPDALEVHNLTAGPISYRGRAAIHLKDTAPDQSGDGIRLAIVKDTSVRDGVVEVSLTGDTEAGARPEFRGFAGIAFRVAPDRSRYECFYLRPKNGRSEDQLQRNHSTQYISFPEFPWQRLRDQSPGKYESYVDLIPGAWTRIKIKFSGLRAELFVNGSDQPALIVNDLKQPPNAGSIALWIGPGTIANFADLTIK